MATNLGFHCFSKHDILFTKIRKIELRSSNQPPHKNILIFSGVRRYASAVSMPEGVYIFGGYQVSYSTWEWLPSGTNQWQSGNTIIQSGFSMGCAVKINDTDILLIGGHSTSKRVLKFNTITKSFTNLGDVLKQVGKYGHACTRFEDKVIVTGGTKEYPYFTDSASTEIIHINDLTTTYFAGCLVQARSHHGLIVVHVENKPTVLAVGGSNDMNVLDSIEMWNPINETWTMTSMKLSEPRFNFGILSLPTRSLCP